MYKTNNLLSQVNSLLKSYDKIAKATGENFNIFTVMGMETDEVKTHSRIIAELLNPKGTHGQGSVFLKLFFEEIEELRSIKDFDFENANVIVEEHIGIINEKYTSGGYIDIVIKDKRNKKEVVIENKIYATDQKGQLYRYKNAYPKSKLLYLTLDGKEPSKESYYHSDENKIDLMDIVLVSYVNNILSWIDKCHKEAIHQPMLREMLKQYSNLLKKLTHQTINNELKMELSELIKNNFLESSQIASNFEAVKNEIITDFFSDVVNSFNHTDKHTEFEMIVNKNISDPYFIKNKNWNNVALAIWIKSNVVCYGVKLIDISLTNKIIKSNNIGNYKSSSNSLLWDDKFVIKINTAERVLDLMTNKEENIKLTVNFIKKMIDDLNKYCIEVNNQIN